MQRTESQWVDDLGSEGPFREQALTDLRSILVAGLARAFHESGPDSILVQDSVQEALVLILKRLETFRGDSRFTTWAMSIATRLALSELRRARWKDVSLDEMSAAGRSSLPTSTEIPASQGYEREQLMAVVRTAIADSLTPRQRDAILAELADVPPEEIAIRLGTNRNALYKVVYDGRVRLRQAILRAGWSEAHVLEVLGGR